MSLSNLGDLLEQEGDLAGARPLYEEALRIERRTLGNEHPRSAIVLAHLADLSLAQGDLGRAGLTRARGHGDSPEGVGRGPCRLRRGPS